MKKRLAILACLSFVIAMIFAFESPPAKANTYDGKPAIGTMNLNSGGNTPAPGTLVVKSNWMASNTFNVIRNSAVGCSQSAYASAGTVAIAQSPHDMINGRARNIYSLNDFRAGHVDGDDPYLYKKNLFAYERKDLVALPSRPVLLA